MAAEAHRTNALLDTNRNLEVVPDTSGIPVVTDSLVWDVWLSAQWLPALTVADALGIFDEIEPQPMSEMELAQRMTLDQRGTTALLRLLAALGFLSVRNGRFDLTDIGRRYLLKTSPHYIGAFIRIGRAASHAQLLKALRDGGEQASTLPATGWARGHLPPDRARAVTETMHAHSRAAALGLAHAADFTGVMRVLDVGGGSGCFSIALATRHADMRCTVMDLSTVCEVAREYIADAGLSARVDTHAADMFEDPWPRGFDTIFLSNVLHDWSFETCRWLLRRAHDALSPGGRVCIHEMLLDDDGGGPVAAAAFSLALFLTTRGQQFTAPELASLLKEVGFGPPRIQATSGYFSMASAQRQ